jgi:cation diffusion facilitator family transporter
MAGAAHPHPPRERDRSVARVLWVVLALNLAVAAAKLLVGTLVGSLALVADGVHAVLDAGSNVVGLIGAAAARRPPDDEHPYGHRRFEAIAASLIGLMIAGGLLSIISSMITAVVERRPPPQPDLVAVVVVLASAIVAWRVSRYEHAKGVAHGSSVLVADAGHTMTDALGSVIVLASFAGVALGVRWADVAAAAIVCVLIGRTAWSVVSSNVNVLADAAQLDAAEVRRVVMAVGGVRDAHRIRSRGTADHVHVDLHIHLDGELPLDDAHDKTHEVADAIREAFPLVRDVVIHTEPYRDSG